MKVKYQGLFLEDTGLAGLQKEDGYSPKGTSVVQLSEDRFCVISGMNDLGGWDMDPTIYYQVRAKSPIGPMLSEGIAMEECIDWQPFGYPLSRCPQFSFGFGVPRGAKKPDGTGYSNDNVFVLQTFINPQLFFDGKAMIPSAAKRYPEWPDHISPKDLMDRLPRVFWRHFRLNGQGDDIEFLDEWALLYQEGYDEGYEGRFCSLGNRFLTMHSEFSPPLPADEKCEEWYTVAGFGEKHPAGGDERNLSVIAPLTIAWDASAGRYRWTKSGPVSFAESWNLTEPGLIRMKDSWIAVARGSRRKRVVNRRDRRYDSFWFRTNDPMTGLGTPVRCAIEGNVPRMAFRCGDNRLRIFFPEERWIPLLPGEPEPFIAFNPELGKYSRDPLVMYDVDPVSFAYSSRRVLFDASIRADTLATPAADLVSITPQLGKSQWLIYRVKDRDATKIGTPKDSLDAMGAHCVEMTYTEDPIPDWRF